MQSGAGDAVKLPDSAFKGVTFADDPQRLVSDADVVLGVQPRTVEVAGAIKEGAILISLGLRPQGTSFGEAASGSEDHVLRHGAGTAHLAGPSDGRVVQPSGSCLAIAERFWAQRTSAVSCRG